MYKCVRSMLSLWRKQEAPGTLLSHIISGGQRYTHQRLRPGIIALSSLWKAWENSSLAYSTELHTEAKNCTTYLPFRVCKQTKQNTTRRHSPIEKIESKLQSKREVTPPTLFVSVPLRYYEVMSTNLFPCQLTSFVGYPPRIPPIYMQSLTEGAS